MMCSILRFDQRYPVLCWQDGSQSTTIDVDVIVRDTTADESTAAVVKAAMDCVSASFTGVEEQKVLTVDRSCECHAVVSLEVHTYEEGW